MLSCLYYFVLRYLQLHKDSNRALIRILYLLYFDLKWFMKFLIFQFAYNWQKNVWR
jgi:hypothetical protein